MYCCWLQFHHVVGGVVVERGSVGGVGGIGVECASRFLCHCWMFHWRYLEGCWSVGVQLRRSVLARMGGDPSHQVGLGVVWRSGGGI